MLPFSLLLKVIYVIAYTVHGKSDGTQLEGMQDVEMYMHVCWHFVQFVSMVTQLDWTVYIICVHLRRINCVNHTKEILSCRSRSVTSMLSLSHKGFTRHNNKVTLPFQMLLNLQTTVYIFNPGLCSIGLNWLVRFFSPEFHQGPMPSRGALLLIKYWC